MLLTSHLGNGCVFLVEAVLEEVVGGVLLVLVAGEVGLGSLVLGETESHEPLDGGHLLGGDPDGSWGQAASSTSSSALTQSAGSSGESTSASAPENEVHEGGGVLLDERVHLGLLLGQLVHELLVERRVRHDSLAQLLEVGVGSQSRQGVAAVVHSRVRHVSAQVVRGRRLGRGSLSAGIGWNSAHQILEGPVRVSKSSLQSLHALIVTLSRDSHQISHLLFAHSSSRLGGSWTT